MLPEQCEKHVKYILDVKLWLSSSQFCSLFSAFSRSNKQNKLATPVPPNNTNNDNSSRSNIEIEVEQVGETDDFDVLYKKCKSQPETIKDMILACVVLHNICIILPDRGSKYFDARFELSNKNSSIQIQEHLLMFN